MQCTDYMEAILLFVNVKQKKLFSDPLIRQTYSQKIFLFVVLSALVSVYKFSLQCQ